MLPLDTEMFAVRYDIGPVYSPLGCIEISRLFQSIMAMAKKDSWDLFRVTYKVLAHSAKV